MTANTPEPWPLPQHSAIEAPHAGERIDGYRGDDIPYVIGQALDGQDLGRIDQVALVLEECQAEIDAPASYTVTISDFREPSWPDPPFWFSQYFPGFLDTLKAVRDREGESVIVKVVADRGGLFWTEDLDEGEASRIAEAARDRGASPLGSA